MFAKEFETPISLVTGLSNKFFKSLSQLSVFAFLFLFNDKQVKLASKQKTYITLCQMFANIFMFFMKIRIRAIDDCQLEFKSAFYKQYV